MDRINELAVSFLLNAAWQVAAVALAASVCARLLGRAPARYRHALWVAALVLSVALPLWSLFDFSNGATGEVAAQPAAVTRASVGRTGKETAAFGSEAEPTTVAGGEGASSFALDSLLQRRRQSVPDSTPLTTALAVCFALFLLYRSGALWRAWRRTVRLRRSASARELPPLLAAAAERCRAALCLRGVPVLCSAETVAPLTVGALAPVVILPELFFEEEQREEVLDSVIGHEMAHVARRDFALNLACELLSLLVSFHPLAAFVKRQIRRTREMACDELVAGRVLGPELYARSLVQVAGALVAPRGQAFTLGVFDADILEERIMRLVRDTRRAGVRLSRLLALTSLSLLCLTCLAFSTFSFDLRTDASAEAATPPLISLEASRAAEETVEGSRADRRGEAAFARPETRPEAAERSRSEDIKQGQENAPQQEDASRQENVPEQENTPSREGAMSRENTPGQEGLTASHAEEVQALSAADPEARAAAACALGRRRAVEAIPALVALLGDESPVRPLRCWASGNWNPALESFKQPSPGEQAAIALAAMGRPAVEPLIEALGDASPSVRRNAAWAVGEVTGVPPFGRAKAVPPLVSLLRDSDEWVRAASARALGELRDARAAEELVAALADASGRVRELAAWALGEMKEERAVENLSGLLASDAQAGVRTMAAWALGEIQNRRAVASLKQALDDPESSVREKAKWALSEIEDDEQ